VLGLLGYEKHIRHYGNRPDEIFDRRRTHPSETTWRENTARKNWTSDATSVNATYASRAE